MGFYLASTHLDESEVSGLFITETVMRTVEEVSGAIRGLKGVLGKGKNPGQPFGTLALLGGEDGATIESGTGDNAVHEF
jgi:hypothetical protein